MGRKEITVCWMDQDRKRTREQPHSIQSKVVKIYDNLQLWFSVIRLPKQSLLSSKSRGHPRTSDVIGKRDGCQRHCELALRRWDLTLKLFTGLNSFMNSQQIASEQHKHLRCFCAVLEEIFHGFVSHWWNENSNLVCFTEIDDTRVPRHWYPWYGPPNNLYPPSSPSITQKLHAFKNYKYLVQTIF